jgi:hypothetical protein
MHEVIEKEFTFQELPLLSLFKYESPSGEWENEYVLCIKTGENRALAHIELTEDNNLANYSLDWENLNLSDYTEIHLKGSTSVILIYQKNKEF